MYLAVVKKIDETTVSKTKTFVRLGIRKRREMDETNGVRYSKRSENERQTEQENMKGQERERKERRGVLCIRTGNIFYFLAQALFDFTNHQTVIWIVMVPRFPTLVLNPHPLKGFQVRKKKEAM